MKRGVKTFARAIRDGDLERAEEMYDKIVQGNMNVGIWEGYQRALGGMVKALDSDNKLTLPSQISEEKFSIEKLRKLKGEMEGRSSQKFRPENDRGFNAAWSDILKVITEDAKSD